MNINLILPTILSFIFGILAPYQQDAIIGVWWVPKQDAKLQVYKENDLYYGKIIASLPEQKDRIDVENDDESLRNRKVLGAIILYDFVFDGEASWIDGKVYDPDNGKTYKCRLRLDKDGNLVVRGYIGIPLLGRTEIFKKVLGPTPKQQQVGEKKLYYLE